MPEFTRYFTFFDSNVGTSVVAIIKYLVAAGADINAKNNHDETPLHRATGPNGDVTIVETLVAAGANVHAKDKNGTTPIHNAIFIYGGRNVEVVKFLVSKGANVNARDNRGKMPLDLAKDLALFNHLSDSGQNIARFRAIYESDMRAVRSQGFALLLEEASRGRRGGDEIIRFLISKGATASRTPDANARYRNGYPLLDYAIENLEIVQFLVSRGADVNVKISEYGNTPLHAAWKIEVARFLVSRGADVNAGCKGGFTPLHHRAAYSNDPEIIAFLVSRGADVNARTTDVNIGAPLGDDTPLHLAAYANTNVDVIKALVSAGADVNAQNAHGKTPLDLAKDARHPFDRTMSIENAEVVEYLSGLHTATR
ncbi:MAG: ankyrin repeat domain-containing protein [Planctomycetaceae bacterium]|nr:ankyrin repeat domain-containing protein [Planctomycetaceae bacterium]